MVCARSGCIERPGESLVAVGLELGFDDGAEHGSLPGEHHDGVCAILDGRDLGERRVGEPRLGEPRNLDIEQLSEQIGGELRTVGPA